MGRLHAFDAVVAGAGIVGLSMAIELRQRGLSVAVLERGRAMKSASWAAGGMLAAHDPENPSGLLPLSLQSVALYPAYLERIEALSGFSVPLRTRQTLQQFAKNHSKRSIDGELSLQEARKWIPGLAENEWEKNGRGFFWLDEDSLDPRDLCRALPAAFLQKHGILLEEAPVLNVERLSSGLTVHTDQERIHTSTFVNCCGAWSGEPQFGGMPVEPVKGQMVNVALEPDRLRCVLRTPEYYAIPRGDGRVTIGATIEHAGFDISVEEHSISELLQKISPLLPEIATARRLESWAGLRPATPDGLPILGPAEIEGCWHATGHYRNGVLLAPVTARVLAQAILRELPDVPLDNFSPLRFAAAAACGSNK